MVPLVLKCHLIVVELLNSELFLRLLIRFYDQTWYPGRIQNVVFEKYIISAFQCSMNHLYRLPGSEVTTHKILINFSNSNKTQKMSFFRANSYKNCQTLHECKNKTKLWNETCDTAFESLNVILLNKKSFGYRVGANGTPKCAYFKHIK